MGSVRNAENWFYALKLFLAAFILERININLSLYRKQIFLDEYNTKPFHVEYLVIYC